jgi:galactose oxidase
MKRGQGQSGYLCQVALMLAICAGFWSAPGASAQAPPSQLGQWSPLPLIPLGNVTVHTHLLPTGKVLFWPRHEPNETRNPDPERTTPRLWDPATLKVTLLPSPVLGKHNLFCSGHAFLPDGQLFVAGGHDVMDLWGLKTAFTYDPVADAWKQLDDMKNGRWYPTVVALPSGEMLVVSGSIDDRMDAPPNQDIHGLNNLPQVWGPGGWRNLTTAKDKKFQLYPFLHVAPNGKVFMSGTLPDTRYLDTSGTGQWIPVATHLYNKPRDYGSSVMYADGKVIVMGGGSDPPTASAEIIDLNDPTPAWKATGSMKFPRRQMNAAILPDGKVFVSGGSSGPRFNNGFFPVLDTESWDPATGVWTPMAPQAEARLYHSTLVLLPSGQLLSSGGGQPGAEGDPGDHSGGTGPPVHPPADADDVNDHFTGQIYSPPYLFQGGVRPAIRSAPTNVAYGDSFTVGTDQAASIGKVTWIRLPSVTHAFNQNQRINVLDFTANAADLMVKAPTDPNLCPPGYYMLFLLDGRGVPSVASIIRINRK